MKLGRHDPLRLQGDSLTVHALFIYLCFSCNDYKWFAKVLDICGSLTTTFPFANNCICSVSYGDECKP